MAGGQQWTGDSARLEVVAAVAGFVQRVLMEQPPESGAVDGYSVCLAAKRAARRLRGMVVVWYLATEVMLGLEEAS